jgi:hypothetical protein
MHVSSTPESCRSCWNSENFRVVPKAAVLSRAPFVAGVTYRPGLHYPGWRPFNLIAGTAAGLIRNLRNSRPASGESELVLMLPVKMT